MLWYGFEECGVVLLKETMADAETFLFNSNLFIEKLVGNMLYFPELYFGDKLAMDNSGILDN